MKKTFALTAALAALALTGCIQAPEFKAAPETMPAITVDDTRQGWADQQIKDWVTEYQGVGLKDAVEEHCVTSWTSPAEGVLRVNVGCDKAGRDLEWLAGDILREGTSDELKTVVAVSDRTGGTATCDREWSTRCETEI